MTNKELFPFEAADKEMSQKVSSAIDNLTKEDVLSRVIPRLISQRYAEVCKERQTNIVIENYMNMAIKYSLPLCNHYINDEEGTLAWSVGKDLFERFEITESELRAKAFSNLKNIPLYITDMESMLFSLHSNAGIDNRHLLSETRELPSFESTMYVVTNEEGMYGANVIMYPELLHKIADALDSDIYIIPSSVHEVLIISTGWCCGDELNAMVKSVNSEEVAPKEQLSDTAYLYKRGDKSLTVVE